MCHYTKKHINSFESLTGAVTFYESPVMFDGTDFLDIKAEDALNIIRSDFTMNNSFFNTTSSDGIDIDFGKGIVQNTTFNMIGNDAIDFSGSTIELYNLEIHSAGDKGISVGEASRVQGSNVIVTDSKIGFACKDLSSLILNSISIDNSSIGFAVFNKKSEFGPGKMKISDYKISNIETNYFVEENSTLLLDGRPVDPSGQNLKEKLY